MEAWVFYFQEECDVIFSDEVLNTYMTVSHIGHIYCRDNPVFIGR
jgi:hypothetical protein